MKVFKLLSWPIILLDTILVIVIIIIIYRILRSPFEYPYFNHSFDVSGRRMPDITELIDTYLIEYRLTEIDAHEQRIKAWKNDCDQFIRRSHLAKRRRKQFEAALDDLHAYRFNSYRKQTRYRQVNYKKIPYSVKNKDKSLSCDYSFLFNRNAQLEQIGYETSLKKYYSKQQRKQMTPKLRTEIIKRDNW